MRSSRESYPGWGVPGVVLVFLLVRKGLDVGREPLGNLVYIVFTAGDGPEERLDLFGGDETVAVEAEAYVSSDKSGAFVAIEERMESDQAVNKRCDLGDELGEQLLAREGGEGPGKGRFQRSGVGDAGQSSRFLDDTMVDYDQLWQGYPVHRASPSRVRRCSSMERLARRSIRLRRS